MRCVLVCQKTGARLLSQSLTVAITIAYLNSTVIENLPCFAGAHLWSKNQWTFYWNNAMKGQEIEPWPWDLKPNEQLVNDFTLFPASFCDLLLWRGVIFKMIWSRTLVRDQNLEQHMCSSKLVTLGVKVNRSKSNSSFDKMGSKSDNEKRSPGSEEN